MVSPHNRDKIEKSLDFVQKKFDENRQQAIDWARSVNPECCTSKEDTRGAISQETAIRQFRESKTEARKKAKNGNRSVVISVGCAYEASDIIGAVSGSKHLSFNVPSGREAIALIEQYGNSDAHDLIIIVAQKLADGSGMGFLQKITGVRGDKILLFHDDTPSPDDIEACMKISCRPWISLEGNKIQRLL